MKVLPLGICLSKTFFERHIFVNLHEEIDKTIKITDNQRIYILSTILRSYKTIYWKYVHDKKFLNLAEKQNDKNMFWKR